MNGMIDVYWNQITTDLQEELIEAGFDDYNVIDCVTPLTTIFVDKESLFPSAGGQND